MKSCSLQLDLNKLDLLSVAPWTNGLSSHGSQYPGRWLGKRICSSWADRARPARVRRSATWPATSLSVCSQWTLFYFSLLFHSLSYITFSFFWNFFFFCTEGWLSSISAEPPSVIPPRGLGNSQNTRPWLMRSVLARKNLSSNSQTFAAELRVHCSGAGITVPYGIFWSMSDEKSRADLQLMR